MARADLFGRTITLKIKHHDFSLNTRQHTLADPVHAAEELMQLARWLLYTPSPPAKPVRLLGLTASNFGRASAANAPMQLTLAIGEVAPPAPAPDAPTGSRPA
jgi:nucleotidyltransferase/DNA polymerase involved in DNA repair